MTIHVVREGDTLYKLARQYGLPLQEVLRENELAEPDKLTPGQVVVLRWPRQTHTVQAGETLYTIARRYGTTVDVLWQNNPALRGGSDLTPGQELVISYREMKHGRLAVNGYAYPFIDKTVLRATLPYLTYLSVFSTGFDKDGQLVPLVRNDLPATAREYGVVPLLVLTTLDAAGMFSGERASDLLRDPAARQRLIDSLLDYLTENGYGGVDIDFEYIPAVDGPSYAAFVADVTGALNRAGLTVMTALAPKTSAEQRGLLYESHDYAALGAASNDALVMTYEWGYARSAPMAVAPIDKVEQVIRYAVSAIPPDRIFMGVPNYGYDWTLPYVEGESVASSIGNVAAVEQAIDVGSFIEYDARAQTPHYNYWRENAEHEVWFEDARSIKEKLALAQRYHLRGVSVWNIMRWFPQLWQVLSANYVIEKVGNMRNMT
ncbi:MAG: LysM peptidoglycan-binding domain-containing protein [Butyricicoccus sp.]|nr:LysM peptidoglycan-binding domain-containing protein [Butyricicoccus sp.]